MSSRNCQYSIRRVQKTGRKYMAMSSRRETRARQGTEYTKAGGKSAPDRLSLSPISGPSDRSRPIDLSRARRRTHGTHARHARHATRTRNAITRRRRTRNSTSRSGNLRFYTPNLRLFELGWKLVVEIINLSLEVSQKMHLTGMT